MSSVSEIINQAGQIQEAIWQTVSSTFSEAANAYVISKDPRVTTLEPDDLNAIGATRQILIQFAFAHISDHTQYLILDESQLAGFLTGIQGKLVPSITEPVLTDSRAILESLVQGICLGVGNMVGEPVAAIGLQIRHAAFDPPENFERSATVVQATGILTLESTRLECKWLFDVETLKVMTAVEEAPSKAFTGKASASEVGPSGKPAEDNSLQLLMDIPLEISVELGRVKMVVRDILELGAGSIVEIDKAAGEPVDVLVNGRLVARGEVVVIEDNFGVRITEILNPAERLAKLNEAA